MQVLPMQTEPKNSSSMKRKRKRAENFNNQFSPEYSTTNKYQKVIEGDCNFSYNFWQNSSGVYSQKQKSFNPPITPSPQRNELKKATYEINNLKKEKFMDMISECQYEIKFHLNPGTNRKNRILVWKFGDCKREFTKTWGLKEHYRVHTHEKPFECKKCHTRFTQKGSLLKHTRKSLSRKSRCC